MDIAAGSIGILSFAVQTAQGIATLKRLWDSVKDAVEEVASLIEELETLSAILSEIDAQNRAHQIPAIDHASAAKSLQLCQKGTDVILTLAKELDSEIGKRKNLGKIKTVLKKDFITKHRERLNNAKTMLMLSYQVYSKSVALS